MNESDKNIRLEMIPDNPVDPEMESLPLEPEPPEPERPIDERRKDQAHELEKEAWQIAGVIKRSRLLEGKLLALVHISKELKSLVSEEKILCLERCAKSFIQDGLYLVLKCHEGLSFFGGRHADQVGESNLDVAYRHLKTVREFFQFTMEIEEAVDKHEEYKEQLRKRRIAKRSGGPLR